MNQKTLIAFLILIVIGVVIVLWVQEPNSYELIEPRETYELARLDTNVLLLDVRTPGEYNNELGHVPNSVLIPLQELEGRLEELEPYKERTIITICRSGNRSGKAAELLARHGFSAMNMEGGMIKWNEAHLPVVRAN